MPQVTESLIKMVQACTRILYANPALQLIQLFFFQLILLFLPADPAKLIQLLLEPDSMERLVVDLVQHAPDHVLPGVPVLAAL